MAQDYYYQDIEAVFITRQGLEETLRAVTEWVVKSGLLDEQIFGLQLSTELDGWQTIEVFYKQPK